MSNPHIKVWPARFTSIRNLLVVLASIWVFTPALANPEVGNSTEITFRFHAPDARSVEVLGDFNAWLTGSNFLHGPDQQGMWQAVVGIPSGTRRVEYVYLVNGQQRLLGSAQLVVPDDFGGANNVWLAP